MRNTLVETVLAGLVLAVAGAFLAFAVVHSTVRPVEGYALSAEFSDAGGVKPGADVDVHGIRVGTVTAVAVDPRSLAAVVRMSIRPDIRLPQNSVAAIGSTGPLGTKLVELIPGHAARDIPPGGRVERTRAYRSLEETVGSQIFGSGL